MNLIEKEEEEGNVKTISTKKIIGIIIFLAAAIVLLIFAGLLTFRVDTSEARRSALKQSGGGKILSESIDDEGLWNDYTYIIQNGNTWYEIEVSGFGNITEVKSRTDQKPVHD